MRGNLYHNAASFDGLLQQQLISEKKIIYKLIIPFPFKEISYQELPPKNSAKLASCVKKINSAKNKLEIIVEFDNTY